MPVLVNINPLAWESNFFGLDTARLEIGGEIPLAEVLQQPYALLQAKISAEYSDVIDELSQNNFQLVAGEVNLAINIKRIEHQTGVYIAREVHTQVLRDAASQAFIQSRFRAPWFNPTDNGRFYAQWIENAIHGTFDNQCLIACDEHGALQGFISIRAVDSNAQVGLLAVLPHVQGNGIGHRLLLAATNWGYVHQLERLCMTTQLSNLKAIRFYLRSGAQLESTFYWFYRKAS